MIDYHDGVVRRRPDAGRRESKYVLGSEVQAASIVDRIRPFVRLDPHAADLPGGRYKLVSLYLDTPSLDLCQDTVRGEKNRFKLRVRRYYRPEAPAFAEVKRRVNEVIIKYRAAIEPDAVPRLLSGAPVRRHDLRKQDPTSLGNLLHFRDLAEAAGATPRMRVSYEREPWIGRLDPRVRITFDRGVVCSATTSCDVLGRDAAWVSACRIPVILEIKFDAVMPDWVASLIREFNLRRTSVPKYVLSVSAARRHGLQAPNAVAISFPMRR